MRLKVSDNFKPSNNNNKCKEEIKDSKEELKAYYRNLPNKYKLKDNLASSSKDNTTNNLEIDIDKEDLGDAEIDLDKSLEEEEADNNK